MLSKIAAAAGFIGLGAAGAVGLIGVAFGMVTIDPTVGALVDAAIPELETIERVREVMPLGWVFVFVVLIRLTRSIARLLDALTDRLVIPLLDALARFIPAPKDPVERIKKQVGVSPRREKEEVGGD